MTYNIPGAVMLNWGGAKNFTWREEMAPSGARRKIFQIWHWNSEYLGLIEFYLLGGESNPHFASPAIYFNIVIGINEELFLAINITLDLKRVSKFDRIQKRMVSLKIYSLIYMVF